MTVGPVDGGRRQQSESAGLGDRFGGGLQPQLAQIRAFCVRVKIYIVSQLFISLLKSTSGDKVAEHEEAGGRNLCSVNICKGDESDLPFSQRKSPAGENKK